MTPDEWKEEINDFPEDIENRERFADWLEEQGRPARGWRRLNRYGKSPLQLASRTVGRQDEYCWLCSMSDETSLGEVCEALGFNGDHTWKRFPTAFEAIAAAANILDTTDAKLPEEYLCE